MSSSERKTTLQVFGNGWPSWIRKISGSQELPVVHQADKLPVDGARKLTGLMILFCGAAEHNSSHFNGGWSVDALIEYWSQCGNKNQELFGESNVQLYVSKNGNFPGGHGLPVSSDNHLITRVKLSDAVNKMRPNRKITPTDAHYLCPGEFYYIYQAHISKFPQPFDERGISKLLPFGVVEGVWISSAGCFTPIHYDNSDNVLMQLHGRKHVIIWRPDDVGNLYLNAEDHPMDRQTQIDFTVMNEEGMRVQFPRFFQSKPYSTTLNPGDALYIPRGWPHAVYSETYSVSMNYWWSATESSFSYSLHDSDDEFSTTTVSKSNRCYICSQEKDYLHREHPDECPYKSEYEVITGGRTNRWVRRGSSYFDPFEDDNKKGGCAVCGAEDHYHFDKPRARCPFISEYQYVCGQVRSYWAKIQKERSSKSYNATIVSTQAQSTVRFWCSGVTYVNGGDAYMLVIGGSGAKPYQMIDSYHFATGRHEVVKLANHSKGTPFVDVARWGHSASLVGDKIYLIGGFDHEYQYNDVVVYDVKRGVIETIDTKGQKPGVRAGHCASVIGDDIYIFGGQYCNNGPYEYNSDLFRFDTKTRTWTQIVTDVESSPEPRSQSACITSHNSIYYIGGSNKHQWFNDLYCLSLDDKTRTTANWYKSDPEFGPKALTLAKSKNFRITSTPTFAFKIHSSAMLNLTMIIGLCDTEGEALILDTDRQKYYNWDSKGKKLGRIAAAAQFKKTILLLKSNGELLRINKTD